MDFVDFLWVVDSQKWVLGQKKDIFSLLAYSTSTTWNGVEPWVLVLGKLPGGGTWYALARNLF